MKPTILMAAITAGCFALGAQAQDTTTQPQVPERMSVSEIAAMLEDQGYTIVEIEFERNRYDVEMIDANGMRVEAYLNPVTGEVLPYRDDDGYERDDDQDDD
ncbi:PepSY domain-containing protein [Maritalea mobilis]|uniref:PepSY domain-containing protein n=1 Tax=Maritalea mobilis TaxID=483324 RepID=UPI001C966C2C|nr:PepSY domain-containing protein [Maritalea mobilis]MBY6202855.1 PepSY domain-containing protein [Maritalea mobilis]